MSQVVFDVPQFIDEMYEKHGYTKLSFQTDKIKEGVLHFYRRLILGAFAQPFYDDTIFRFQSDDVNNPQIISHQSFPFYKQKYQAYIAKFGLEDDISDFDMAAIFNLEKMIELPIDERYIQIPECNYAGDYFVCNFDVGLGKTLTSILIQECIRQTLPIMFNTLKEEGEGVFAKYSTSTPETENMYKACKFIKDIWKNEAKLVTKDDLVPEDIKINIVAKASIAREFNNTLVRLGIKNYQIFPSGKVSKNEPKKNYSKPPFAWTYDPEKCFDPNGYMYAMYTAMQTWINVIAMDMIMTHDTAMLPQWRGYTANTHTIWLLEQYVPNRANRFSFWILDEFGKENQNSIFFSASGPSNNIGKMAKLMVESWGGMMVCLTADTVNESMTKKLIHQGIVYNSGKVLKADVMDELVSSHLYKQDAFKYRNIFLAGKEIEQYEKIKEKYNQTMKDYMSETENFNSSINDFTQLISKAITVFEEGDKDNDGVGKGDVEIFSENVKKAEMLYTKYLNRYDFQKLINATKTLNDKIKDIKIKSFYKSGINNLISDNYLDYLFEKNTIIIVDPLWTDKQITDAKESFKKSELNVVTLNTYDSMNIEAGGNVLIGRANELSRGLNLQHFNNIVFMFFNELGFDEVNQGIGRTDRLGTVEDKEVVLMSFNQNEALLDKIMQERKNITEQVNIENVTLLKDIKIPSSIKNEIDNRSEGIKLQLTNIEKKVKDASKEYDKDVIEGFKESKDILMDIVKDFQSKMKAYNKFLNTFGGSSNETDEQVNSNLEMMNNLVGIFSA